MIADRSRTIFFVGIAIVGVIYGLSEGSTNWLYTLVHLLVIALSLSHVMLAKSFNLGLSFSFFSLFFFGILPLFEYKLGLTYHGTPIPSDSSYITAAFLALLSCIFFYLGYSYRKAIRPDLSTLAPMRFYGRSHRVRSYFITTIALFGGGLLIAAFHEFDLDSLLFRSAGEEIESSTMLFSFVNFYFRPLFFNLLFIVILARVRHDGSLKLGVVLLTACLILIVSPIGVARTLAGALYIPFVALVFFPKLASKFSLLCIVVAAILVAAPMADVFRRVLDPDESLNLIANFNLEYFFAGHYDAFHNLVQVVETDYSSEGFQTLGAFLFWVPRSMWPGKPNGTSFDFAEFAGYAAHNISFPLTADMYVDYGMIGVVVGMFVIGVLYKSIDNFLAQPRIPGSLRAYAYAIARLELGILGVYLLRGNFLSSLAFTFGVISTLAVVVVVDDLMRPRKSIAANDVPSTAIER